MILLKGFFIHPFRPMKNSSPLTGFGKSMKEESPMPAQENFYDYHPVDKDLAEKIRTLSMEAYAAVNGTGYTRIDLRMDQETGAIKVLEVNAQCGLSEDEDYTSIGAILRVNGTSFGEMMLEIFQDAITRKSKKWD